MSIKDIMDLIVKQGIKDFQGLVAQVNSVDPSTKTCEVTDLKGGIIIKVRLLAANTTGLYLIPTVGSYVIVHMISDQDYYVSMFSQLDGVTMLDGSFGGLVEVVNLVTKLNALENKVNAHLSAYNTHVHTGVTTGGGSSGPTSSTVAGSLTPTVRADIENVKITHGQ